MAQSSYAERILADASEQSARSPDGRLSLPDMSDWDIFPFEGDLQVKELDDVVLPEPLRRGETGASDCHPCSRPDSEDLWNDDHWRLVADHPMGLPAAVLLEPRGHHDLADLPEQLAQELGPMLLRVERALLSLGGIGRVHINRWGDGGAHLHWWFLARPEGLLQLMGSFSSLWMDVLPPRPQEEWDATMARIAASMRAGDA